MADKAKRALGVFESHLTHDEHILWVGQPDAHKLLSFADVYLIPFSLFWCGILLGFGRNPMGVAIFVLPHFWIGMYMLWGRYLHKYLRRRNLYYAITNRRVLILDRLWRNHLETLYIKTLPALNFHMGRSGYGTLTFETTSRWDKRRNNFNAFIGEDSGPGFYDIPDAQAVYHLINDLKNEQDTGDELYKRKVEDLHDDVQRLAVGARR